MAARKPQTPVELRQPEAPVAPLLSTPAPDPGPTGSADPVRGAATVFSDYASVVGARLGAAVLSLASVLLLTRMLAPTGYGTLAFFTIVAMLIFTITSAWTSTAASRYGREELEARGQMIGVTWGRAAITAPLVAIAAVLIPTLKALGGLPPEFTWALVWLAVGYGCVFIVSEHILYLLEAAGRIKLSALGMLCQQAAVVGSLAVVYVTGSSTSPAVIATIWLVGLALVTAAFSTVIWRQALWPPSIDRALLRRMVLFSAPMIAFTVSQYVIRSVDLVVIRGYGTVADVGVYAVAYQGYTVLQALASAAPPILTPLFVSLRSADRESLVALFYERVVPQLTFVGAVLGGLAAPFAIALVPPVFGDEFADAATPMAILLIPIVLLFGANLLAPIVVLHERTKAVGILNSVAAAVNVVGDVVLIGPLDMGIAGAAIATAAAVAIVWAGYLEVGRKAVGSTRRLHPALLTPLAVGLAPGLVWGGWLGVATGTAAAAVSALAVQRWLRPFAPEDAELVARLDMPPRLKALVLRGLAFASR